MKLSLKKIMSKTSGNARTKPGSVLIMVVGLLVLLALIGTAFLSSSHAERSVSIQATTDARVDLLVQGVEQMAKATIASGGINPNPDPNTGSYPVGSVPATVLKTVPNAFQLRPKFDEPEFSALNSGVPMGYGDWDMPDMQSQFTNSVNVFGSAATAAGAQTQRFFVPVDSWLSPRFPQPVPAGTLYTPYNTTIGTLPPNATFTNSSTGKTYPLPTWLSIGKPLIGDHFESPFVGTISGGVETLNSTITFGQPLQLQYQERLDPWVNYAAQNQGSFLGALPAPTAPTIAGEFVPRFIQVPPNSGNWFPAWYLQTPLNKATSGSSGTPAYYLAGDADGDGVADCGMFRLPSNLDGLTWYAGVRIVDNGSAVNVNTAWDRDSDYDGNANAYLLPTSPASPGFAALTSGAGANYSNSGVPAYNYGQVPYTISQGMFTANVGLQELLHTWIPENEPFFSSTSGGVGSANQVAGNAPVAEMTYLNEFRFNCQSLQHYTNSTPVEFSVNPLGSLTLQEPQGVFYSNTAGALSSSYPFDEYYDAPTQNPGSNVPASTQQRTDFWYLTMGDALQSLLGRRLNNPGNLSAGNDNFNGAVALQAQPYGLEDSAALAYHFCLINPATIAPGLATNTFNGAGTGTISQYGVPSSSFYGGGSFVAATSWGYGITGSKIERDLYRSVFDTAPNSPFPPSSNNPAIFPGNTWVGFTNLRNSGQSQYSPAMFTDAGIGTYQAAETVACWYRDNFEFEDEGPALPTSPPSPPGAGWNYWPQPSTGNFVANLGFNTASLSINFKPRRSMLVATNAVSNLMPWVDPPDYNSANSNIPTAATLIAASVNPGTLSASVVMGYGNSGTNAGTPSYTINSTPNLVPKANPNTSSFGDLWRAYWGVMATDHAVGAKNTSGNIVYSQSPFGGTYTINTSTQSLYLGRQFTPYVLGVQTPPTPEQYPAYTPQNPSLFFPSYNVTASQNEIAQGPNGVVTQEMFCSPIRDNHVAGTAGIIQFNPDQVMLLRSALAAQNTIIMRDPLHGCYPAPPVGLGAGSAPAYYFNGALRQIVHLGKPTGGLTPYDAVIYGAMQNPYITQVYINTDNQTPNPTGAGPVTPNSDGYVAIELFNPYPFNIPLNGWALAVVDRGPTTSPGPITGRAHIIYTFGNATPSWPKAVGYTAMADANLSPMIPANNSPASRSVGGYLILENYENATVAGTAEDYGASYRPQSVTAINASGTTSYSATAVPTAPIQDIYVPNLATALFYNTNPTVQVCTQELVLLRPVTFNGSSLNGVDPTTVEYVPVDSFDFTGLPNPPGTTSTPGEMYTNPSSGQATGWHYVRPNGPIGYPENTNTATDNATVQPISAMPTLAPFGTPSSAFLTGNAWRFIYPGRYDGGLNPTVTNPPPGGMPRQQGVHTEIWQYSLGVGNGGTEPWSSGQFPGIPDNPPSGPGSTKSITFGVGNLYGSYPIAFPFRYLDDSLPGPNPIQAVSGGTFSNLAPFGAFARDADIARVPFVGAYSIVAQGQISGAIVSPFAPSVAVVTAVQDYNTLSSDLSMGEDTDITDDPIPDYSQSTLPPAGNQSQVEWTLWHEEVGRFCPVMNTAGKLEPFLTTNAGTFGTTGSIEGVDDGNPLGGYHTSGAATPVYWRYHWAQRLYDFLSTQTPHNDFLPNVDKTAYDAPNTAVSGAAAAAAALQPTPVSNSGLPALAYQPPTAPGVLGVTTGTISSSVYAAGNSVGTNSEAGVGIEGKININTANWRVLSTLPWVPPGMPRDQIGISSGGPGGVTAGSDGIDDNVQLAQIICDWRDGTNYTGINNQLNSGPAQLGPFRSIYDLYKIPPLYQYYAWMLATHEPSPNYGDQMGPTLNYCLPYNTTDLSTRIAPAVFTGVPVNFGFDGVRLDFEERANMLGRLSNLITTRSDSFTVYIVVQGWKNAGSTNPLEPPQLVVQRRSAFIADRSGITAPGGQVKTYNFPND